MTLCHYEGWTSAWDEYMSMGRIRSAGTDGGAPRSR